MGGKYITLVSNLSALIYERKKVKEGFFNQMICWIIALVWLVNPVFAQNISISASVDKNSTVVGEAIQLRISVSGDIASVPQPQLPDLSPFTVQSSGRSQSVSIVNGRVSSSVSFNYYLIPRQAGKFVIGPATIQYDSKTFSTNPIEIEVAPSSAGSGVTSPRRETTYQGETRDLFIETSVDKRSAYVNEQITLAFRFYTRVNLLSQPQYTPPSTVGFVSEDLPPQRNYRTTINMKEYAVTELKTAVFPANKGKLTIGPALLRCTIEDFDLTSPDSFFRNFFSSGKTVELKTNPITIEVKEPPSAGRPSDFSGAVGNFTIAASVDKKATETGKPITLTVSIRGKGNIKAIPQPKIETPGFKQYETISSLNVSKENYTVSGSKDFKTIIVPSRPGRQVIPPISFSYFDPASDSYKTIATQPIVVDVAAGAQVYVPPQDEKLVQPKVAEDIRHIKQNMKSGAVIDLSHTALYLQLIPLALFLAVFRISRSKERILSDKKLFRRTYGYKIAVKSLKKIKRSASSLSYGDVVSSLAEILKTYIGDKLNISSLGATNEGIISQLKWRGVDDQLCRRIEDFLSDADASRYSPSRRESGGFSEKIRETEEMISLLEKALR